jgi:hypothetical protein
LPLFNYNEKNPDSGKNDLCHCAPASL